MASDLYVSFGAETGPLEAALALTKAQLSSLTREATSTAREMAKAGADMDSALGSKLTSTGAKIGGLRAQMADLRAEMSKGGTGAAAADIEKVATGLNRMQQMEGAHVLKSIFDEIAAGASPLRAVSVESGRIAEILMGGGISMGFLGIAGAVVAAGAAMAYFVSESQAYQGIADSLKNGLMLSGHGGLMSDADMAEAAAQINTLRGWFSGLGEDEAKTLAKGFRDVPGMMKEISAEVVALIPDLSKALDLKEGDVGKKIQDALKADDAAAAIKVLIGLFGGLSEAHRKELEATDASLDPHQREAAVLRVMAEALKTTREERVKNIDAEIAEKKAQAELFDLTTGMGSWATALRLQVDLLEQEKKWIEDAIAATRAHADAIKNSTSSAAELAQSWGDILDKMDPAGAALREMAANAEKIKAGLNGVNWPSAGGAAVESGAGGYGPTVTGDAFSFLKDRATGGAHVEGLNATFSSLLTKALADAEAATGTKATFNSAYRDPDSRETQDLWERSGHGTRFTMVEPHTSAHSVGAAVDLNRGAALGWLHEHIANYPGLQFLPPSAHDYGHLQYAGGRAGMLAAGGPSLIDSARANAAVANAHDKNQAEADRLAGGSVVDKQELADAKALAAQKHDDLQAEKDRISALVEQRGKTEDANKLRELDGQIATENAKKIQMENAAKEAQLRLDVAAAKGDPEARHAAELKLAEFRRQQAENLHGLNSPEEIDKRGEKTAADDRNADAKSSRLAKDTAEEIRLAHEAGNETRKVLDDNEAHHKITIDQWQADTAKANVAEAAAIKASYAKQLADDNLSADKRKDIEAKEADEIRKIGQKTTDDARKAGNERASEADAIARENAQEEIRLAHDKATAARQAIDDAVSHERMSASAGAAAKLQINQEEEASVRAAMQKEIDITDQGAAEKLRKEHELQDKLRQLRQQSVQDQQKAADQQSQAMEGYANTIFGPVNSAIRSAMSGHANFRQIAVKAAEDAGMKALEWIEREIVKHLMGQTAMTGATVAGEAARAAAKTAGSGVGVAADAAQALKTIMTSGAATFAGVFGFLAPVLGPFAAGPAAAAEGTVLSAAGAIASADIGMWRVPGDQLAMIHRNELVATPSQADAIRAIPGALAAGGGAGAGGNSLAIHPQMNVKVGAMDASDFGRFLKNNQRELMSGMSHAVRQGAHLGLKGLGA